jgi:hypothetical protein
MLHLIQQLRERLALSRAPSLVSLEPRNALSGKAGFSFYIDLHVVVDGKMTVREGHAIAHAVKNQLLLMKNCCIPLLKPCRLRQSVRL